MEDLPPLIRAYAFTLRCGLNAAVDEVLKAMPEEPARWWPPDTLHATLTRDCVDPAVNVVDAWHTGVGRRFVLGHLWVVVPPERGDAGELTTALLGAIESELEESGVPNSLSLAAWGYDDEAWFIEARIGANILPEEVAFVWAVPSVDAYDPDNPVVSSAPSREEGIRFLRHVIREFPLEAAPRLRFRKTAEAMHETILACMDAALVAGDDPQDLFGVFDGAFNFTTPPLVYACKLGLLPCARWIVTVGEEPADDPRASDWGHPVINTAIIAGHTEVVRWLLDSCGVPPFNDPAVEDRKQPLVDAIEHGRVDIVQLLVTTYCVPFVPGAAFRKACRSGHLELAQWLVQEHGVSVAALEAAAAAAADADEVDFEALLPVLKLCCESGNLPLCQWALSQGAYLEGNTLASPLASACCGSALKKDVFLWLLQQGANPLRRPSFVRSCFMGVCHTGELECAQALWALPSVREVEGNHENLMEAIELACGSGNMELVQWLIGVVGCGAVIEVACDEEAWYSSKPIASACKRGQLEVARWLVAEYGLRRLCHDPPLVFLLIQRACESGDLDTTAWLMEQGQDMVAMMLFISVHPDAARWERSYVSRYTTFPFLVKEYGAHWEDSLRGGELEPMTEGDRRWYRRREWIFGLVTLALRRRSPEGAAAAPASDVEPPQDSATEGKEGVAGAEESLETRSDVQTPGVPEADTDSAACTGAVSAPDPGELEMLALLLSTRLAQTPSPHTGSPAHLISRIAGVCVSFLSDCCSAPECPTQEPFEGPA